MRKLNEKKKRKRREKVEECETKGEDCWPSPNPHLSLLPQSLSFAMGLLASRGTTKESHEIFVPEIAK